MARKRDDNKRERGRKTCVHERKRKLNTSEVASSPHCAAGSSSNAKSFAKLTTKVGKLCSLARGFDFFAATSKEMMGSLPKCWLELICKRYF
ncbi:hypothetical protein Leryth_008385 [Lithospermum erythrorhizon]|nr:hypothetical protein Leryth_008385 [Lithospermum erythrorhizon]